MISAISYFLCNRSDSGGRKGFTLIEVLLVLAIIGIITAITIPQFVNSMRGNRLRVAVSSVVRAGRFARSMAVMKQTDIVLSFDVDKGTISVNEVSVINPPTTNDVSDVAENDDGEPVAAKPVVKSTELLSRKLDQVSFDYVEINDDTISGGTCSIIYSSNGRCEPYTVKVKDEYGKSVVIKVDALSSARTESD